MNDGFAKTSCVFIVNAAEKLETTKIYSVIQPIKEIKKLKDVKYPMLTDFEIINEKVNEIIGDPIDLELYKRNNRVNLDGNTSIPFRYLEGIQPKIEPSSNIEPEEEKRTSNQRNNINKNDSGRMSDRNEKSNDEKREKINEGNERSNGKKFERFDEGIDEKIENIEEEDYNFGRSKMQKQNIQEKTANKQEKVLNTNEKMLKPNSNIGLAIESNRKSFFEKFKVIFKV